MYVEIQFEPQACHLKLVMVEYSFDETYDQLLVFSIELFG